MASPIRTCIGCRRRGPAAEMLRLRAAGSGRGASVHQTCVEQAMRPEVLSRAFKRPVKAAEGQQLQQQLQTLQQQQLSIASRRKRL